jgi:heterodisulfide reductase subunit A-like polyferredoxin
MGDPGVAMEASKAHEAVTENKPLGSYPKTGIDVLIVGTGLAGLTAAIECARKGHNVHILERNATVNTAGELPSSCK